MSVALLGARLLLVSIFAVAAVAKLYDRPGSRQAIFDFDLPAPLASLFGPLLPLAELTVDAEGNVASEMAVGAPGVFELAGARERKLETTRLENNLAHQSARKALLRRWFEQEVDASEGFRGAAEEP